MNKRSWLAAGYQQGGIRRTAPGATGPAARAGATAGAGARAAARRATTAAAGEDRPASSGAATSAVGAAATKAAYPMVTMGSRILAGGVQRD
jgi:hypothetical protein